MNFILMENKASDYILKCSKSKSVVSLTNSLPKLWMKLQKEKKLNLHSINVLTFVFIEKIYKKKF